MILKKYAEYLANEVDTIRGNYWNWVRTNIQEDFKNVLQ